MSLANLVLRTLLVSLFSTCLIIQHVYGKTILSTNQTTPASQDLVTAELSDQLQLKLSFPPLFPDNENIHYEVICRFRDPKNYDNFPYVNNFIRLDKENSTPELYVGTVNLKGLIEPYRGAEMICSVQYRAIQNDQIEGGEVAELPPLFIPSQPKIIVPLTKTKYGIYTLIFRYQFPEESLQNSFSLQCRNSKEIVQYNFESESLHLDTHQVELDLREWEAPKAPKNIRECHLIARYNLNNSYQSELIGFAGKVSIFRQARQ
jgi:hypothetical protein